MPLTRRVFAQGSAAWAAAAILPARVQDTVRVRRSVGDLIREQSPQLESYRRGVDVMMKRDVVDKTSWWFQADIHDLPEFGGAGGGAHGRHNHRGGGETLVFEASDAVAQLSRTRSFELRNLRVAIVRRGFAKATGGEFVPDDPDPPRIGAIELLQS